MIFTSLFGLFAAFAFGAPFWAFVVGFLCFIANPLVTLYGLFLCIAYDAPFWVYLVGIICMLLDSSLVGDS